MNKLQEVIIKYVEYLFADTMNQVYDSPKFLFEKDQEPIFLDCGAHNGENTKTLANILETNHFLGIDINQNLAFQAKNKNVTMIISDMNSPFPLKSETVDVITSFNLLEHLVETHQFLTEIKRILTPGGYAIISTPNLSSWHNIIALIIGLQPFSGPNITSMTDSDIKLVRILRRRAHKLSDDSDIYVTSEPERYRHIVVVAYRSLVRALKQLGFKIEKSLGIGYYPLPPFLASIVSRIDPFHTAHMVVKVRKPE